MRWPLRLGPSLGFVLILRYHWTHLRHLNWFLCGAIVSCGPTAVGGVRLPTWIPPSPPVAEAGSKYREG